jgi:hypothetical protein
LLISAIFLSSVVSGFIDKKSNNLSIYSAVLPLVSMVYLPFSLVISLYQLLFIRRKEIFRALAPLISVFWIILFYKIFGSSDQSGFPPISASILFGKFSEVLSDPFKICFTIFTQFFSNYYWLLFPLLLSYFFIDKRKEIRFLVFWFLLYPLTGLNFSVYFKFFLFLGFLSISFFIYKRVKTIISYEFIPIILFYAIFQTFDFLFSSYYDMHQVYAILIPPFFYILVIYGWGYFLSNKSTPLFSVILLLIAFFFNIPAICEENNRSFVQRKADKEFLHKFFTRLAPDKKIKSAYCSEFTLMPFIHYDRVGDDLSHHSDEFITTLLSIDLLTREDTLLARSNGAFHFFEDLPLARFIASNPCKGASLNEYRLKFLKHNKVTFLFRKENYPRSRLDFLNPWIIDSIYNHQVDYQVLKLNWHN